MKRLEPAEIEAHRASTPDWSVAADRMSREFVFADFVEAFGFMTSVTLLAEIADHHPEWFNVYGMLRIDLTTHEVSGISEHDFELASAINQEFDRRTLPSS